MVATNRATFQAALRQLEASATQVNALLSDLQAGKGLAGSLLKNDQLERQFHELVGNLTLVSSNLNKFGILYKPKPMRTGPPPAQPGKPHSG